MRADVRTVRHGLAALAGGTLLACATPPTPRPRISFPFWSVREARGATVGCAQLLAWVSKSGKEGLGASVQVSAPEAACPVSIDGAAVELASLTVNAAPVPPPRSLAKGEVARAYLPFLFDNEGAWNRGEVEGRLVLRVTAGGRAEELRWPMIHKPFSFLREPAATSTAVPSVQKLELRRLDVPPTPPTSPTPAGAPQGAP